MSADMLDLVWEARSDALSQVTANAARWDIQCVDAVILHLADTRSTFSANDARDLISELPQRKLIGARFNSLRLRGVIEIVGDVVSTDPGTHGKKIGIYRKVAVHDHQTR